MGESFQDYSWIQDFEDFSIESQPQNAEFSFSDFVSGYLKVFDHLTRNFW